MATDFLIACILFTIQIIEIKECNESDYWIDLLYEINSLSKDDFDTLKGQIIELRRMLVSSVTTLNNKD